MLRKYFTTNDLEEESRFCSNYKSLKLVKSKKKNNASVQFKILIVLDEAYPNVRVSLDTFKKIELAMQMEGEWVDRFGQIMNLVAPKKSLLNTEDIKLTDEYRAVCGK